MDRADTPVDKLRNLIRSHLEAFQRDRNMAIVYQAETRQKHRIVEEQIKTMSKMYYELIAEIIELGQRDGSMRKELYVALVKRLILGTVDEVINTWIHSNGTYDLASMTNPLMDLFIRGIGNPGPSKSRCA